MAMEPQNIECTRCDPPRKFKSRSGLRGHAQVKHGELPDRPAGSILATPQSSRMELLGQISEEVSQLLDGQQELLQAAQRPAEQLSEAFVAALNKIEQQFRSLQELEFTRERKVAISEISDIPGVREAMQYERWATQRNKDGPEKPVPTCWQDVHLNVGNLPEHPVIRDVIEKFQLLQQILYIET